MTFIFILKGGIIISYNDLYTINSLENPMTRFVKFVNYYKAISIEGLHYVNFDPLNNIVSISHPNHRTHHFATCFLLRQKRLVSINTLRNSASDLKKFLDFLMIWEIDLLESDLLVVLTGFVEYLKCINPSPSPKFENSTYFYSTLTKLPLNDIATSHGKLIHLENTKSGLISKNQWNHLDYLSFKKILGTAVSYLKFLKERTKYYEILQFNQLPVKQILSQSMLSGTIGKKKLSVIDLEYILSISSIYEKKINNSSLDLMVLTLEETNALLNTIPSTDYQNKLLFTILKCFGLRAGEAATLQINTSKLSSNFLYLDDFSSKEDLRNNLFGDIEYNKIRNKWICHVNAQVSTRYNQQSKTGGRSIPLVFSENEFLDALVYGIKERFIIMHRDNRNHNYLFVSKSSHYARRGLPITSNTIYTRFTTFCTKLHKQTGLDLSAYSPHSLRHFYATYLIREKKYDLLDVSRWLGHASDSVTRETYFHFIDPQNNNINISEDIAKTFRKEITPDA